MRQVVLLKAIPDVNEIKFDPRSRAPVTAGVKKKISELDKRALEAAIQTKDAVGGEVVVLSMGDDKTNTALLAALAMGADGAYIVIDTELTGLDTNATSKVLEAAMKEIGEYDLIISGEMTLDSMSSQIGPRLAELLELPQVTYVKEFSVADGKVTAVRDLEDVDEVVEVALPALITVTREINEPRIPSLMKIMRAKKKPRIVWDAPALGLEVESIKAMSYVIITDVTAPLVERKQIKIEANTVEEVAAKLTEALAGEGVI
ncbi:electron transfer flavoprotein subunit beta/FixA family protein [Candidatus Bathyarchaeota archaeon]|nr:electron transfer flavoprotein subunit beta/FixA family protein [Candidatus Bathyarchaeota archaeon]MBT7913082.1 electron transfer flavoprotein subunit beta/FixA family protein [Candidatus Bathyarchaeota archaeon]